MSYLDRIRAIQTYDAPAYRPFIAGDTQVGLVHRDIAGELGGFPDILTVTEAAVTLAPGLADHASRTAASGISRTATGGAGGGATAGKAPVRASWLTGRKASSLGLC